MPDFLVSKVTERLAVSPNIDQRLSTVFRLPTVVLWNRLEGRPRSDDLARPLRAEVRDPAWMLARQWQFGEFEGEDAGTPTHAKLSVDAVPISQIALRGGTPQDYDPNTPLESLVEQQRVEPDLMMGLYVGRHWLQQLAAAFGAADPILVSFKTAYPVASPAPGAKDLSAIKINAHRQERELRRALAGASLDGSVLLADIRRAATTPSDVFAGAGVAIGAGRESAIDDLAAQLVTWFVGLFGDASPGAWVPTRLEYDVSLTAREADGGTTQLVADQFPGGHLDWYSFDEYVVAGNGGNGQAPKNRVQTFVPARVNFFGAPSVRWWEFEDHRVGFGLTTASKTDIAKVLLAEFGLVFSNDWFILPLRADIGSLLFTKGVVVSDNFGMNTLVEPVAKRQREQGFVGHWSMWTIAKRGAPAAVDARLLLAPALEPPLESRAIDETMFLRDEMANLVWGVETVIPSPLGGGRDARLAAKELSAAVLRAFPPPAPVHPEDLSDVHLRYQLMGSVPENWIPFVAVKRVGEQAASTLLQGAMPRVPTIDPALDDDSKPILQNNVVLARGTILARDPVGQPNTIHEEEILRDGIVVRRQFRKSRWLDGRTFAWSALSKQAGRGEGSSGLAFDQVIEKPAPNED